jgi:monoamine oxidase
VNLIKFTENKNMKIYSKDIIKTFDEGVKFENPSQKIIIIGAGAAGLAAGHFLHKSGIECTILEASNRYGGRVWSNHTLAPIPVELGAEEIHGENSAWYWLLQTSDIDLYNYNEDTTDFYFFENALIPESILEKREDFQQAVNYWDVLLEHQGKEALPLHIWLKKQEKFGEMTPFLKAWIENAYGAPSSQLNIPDMVKVGNSWNSGEEDFVLEKEAYQTALGKIFKDALPFIQYEKIVQKIDYQGDKIKVHTQDNQVWEADKVLITIALPQLQKQAIEFIPALPSEKIRAIEHLKIGNVIKLTIRFREAFWSEDSNSIYSGGEIPEFYTSSKDDTPLLTAYIGGDAADSLSKLGETATLEIALKSLSKLYNEPIERLYEGHTFTDWQKIPFVEGAYSYPHLHAERYRPLLARPVEEKLFFAGEATNYHGHAGTVHGAIESAYRAVQEMS